ncbi:hypothetical protein DJ021_10680 [Phenylobacterium hankyongense]|uniref:Uncharacterized protein n=1 Tax=Phenylobacterium hankyongense TaxID=1813876 RepID=A0A328B314_9CAUL|nr:hypothetical protein DJ021_10680 [Phenylobacterium hankyongense]
MLRRIAAGVDEAQRRAAAQKATLLLQLAQTLNETARRLLGRRRSWLAWSMFRTTEALGHRARRIWAAEMRRRRR